jgi:hypothetical protein
LTALHSPGALPISLFEKREELRRILESKHFASSPKKSKFLEFVAEQTFLGNGDKLNEYLIGLEVYDRGPGFNSQKDPIVRVQAHEIRRLLKKYYDEEGKDSLSGWSCHLAPTYPLSRECQQRGRRSLRYRPQR